MTFEQSKAAADRTQIMAKAGISRMGPKPPGGPSARNPTPQSFPVGRAVVAALLAAGRHRQLDARFTPDAVNAAAIVAGDVVVEAAAEGVGLTFDGVDPYEEAAEALALGVLHLRRAQLQLSMVRASDRTLMDAIHGAEDALVACAVLRMVQPEAAALARFVAGPEVASDDVRKEALGDTDVGVAFVPRADATEEGSAE